MNNLVLAPDYDPTEFAPLQLLEQGDVDIWVRRRGVFLLDKSKETAKECEAGKLASAITVGASIVMSANPLAWLPLTVGAVGYIYTVFQEFQDTGSIRLIPMYRGKLGDILKVMEGGQAAERHPLEDRMEYLAEAEKDEVLLLNYRFGDVVSILSSAPPKVRFDLYRHLCGQFHARRDLLSGDEVKHYITAAVSPERRTAIPPHSQPALEQGEPKAIPEGTASLNAPAQAVTQKPSKTVPDEFVDLILQTKPLPPFDRDRIINESKGLMIIGDMGAAKTCVAQYIANGFNGYGIIVFDPHGMTDWGNAYVITKMGAIYEQMRILLDLLENGDTSPLLIICDEWLEIRGDRRNKKGSEYAGLADDFIRLFSTKPRKFNKLAAFVLHSPNVEAAGVDSFLRENYLKVYLGRLAKKEFPHIQDCAYPCVVEDEQQEHPTHGHHAEFQPKGKVPRNLQPLQSAAINIPLAYMKGSEVEVCDRGWADGHLRLNVVSIRNQLEMLYHDTGTDTSIDTDTSYQGEEKEDDTGTDTGIDTSDTGNDTAPTEAPETIANTSGSDGIGQIPESSIDTEGDTKRYTPANLTREQMLILIQQLQSRMSQTQLIQDLWCVEKNKQGWKQAYAEFKELTGQG